MKRHDSEQVTVFTFIIPLVFIIGIITGSSIILYRLKNLQDLSLMTLYEWEKVRYYSSERYTLRERVETEVYKSAIGNFDNTLNELNNSIPLSLLNENIRKSMPRTVEFWEYIRSRLDRCEEYYIKLVDTELGSYLQSNTISKVIIENYEENSVLNGINFRGILIYKYLESEYNILMNAIDDESYFEKRLFTLHVEIESIARRIALILLILDIVVIGIIIFFARNYLKHSYRERIRSEENLSNILNSIGDAMIVLDLVYIIEKVNPFAEKLLNIQGYDIRGESIFKMLHFYDNSTESHVDFIKDIYSKTIEVYYSDNISIKTVNNDVIPVSLSCSPVFDRRFELVGVVLVFKDITIRKKQEREIIMHKEHLEDMVVKRTEKLEESLEELKRTQEQLIESEKMASLAVLVSGVAHEINTPLGIVLTASTFLEDELQSLKPIVPDSRLSNVIETATLISSNTKRADKLIQSFKQIAVDHHMEDKRRFPLIPYMEEVVSTIDKEIVSSDINIKVKGDRDIIVMGYPGVISRIIIHLIMNAMAHGFENRDTGHIDIDVKEKESFIYLTFSDDGNGIPKDIIGKIFDPFITTKRGFGSPGLGMNVVYNLVVQKLKGNIRCESKDGAIFYIEFPSKL